MARVKNTMKMIEKTIGCINNSYDMCVENMNDIYRSSANCYDMICNGFRFGYMQGMKAARSEIMKGSDANG